MCLCSPRGKRLELLDLGENVGLTQDQQVLAVDLDLGAAVLAVEDLVALAHVKRRALAGVLVDLAVADGQDLALLGLLLGGIRKDDPTCRGLLFLDRPNDQTIAQGLKIHLPAPPLAVFEATALGARMRRVPARGSL